jgi:nucleoside-triphosphatase
LRDHPGAKIFTLSPSNRDAVKEQIYTQLVDSE